MTRNPNRPRVSLLEFIHVGFTATQQGLTISQSNKLISRLERVVFRIGHHGDCVGGDAEIHNILEEMEKFIHIHPPINSSRRAWKKGKYVTKINKPKDYLVRNRDIVVESQLLVAAPAQKEEQLRSGTWSTVRYARAMKRPVLMIYPDGSSKLERPNAKNTD